MSFDAIVTCPTCGQSWYECADYDETFECDKCGHKDIEPEEIDLVSQKLGAKNYVHNSLQKNVPNS